jgi:transketolase
MSEEQKNVMYYMVGKAMEAAEKLSDEISVRVVNVSTIKPLNTAVINALAADVKGVVTAEEHSVIGGLGDAVAQVVVKNCPCRMAMVGQQDTFGESGKPDQLLAKYKMTAADIAEAVRSVL